MSTQFLCPSGLPKIFAGGGCSPLFPKCDTNLQHLIHFWKALGLYLNNLLKKFANLQNFKYLMQYQVVKLNMRRKKSARDMINYKFLIRPCHGELIYVKIFAKFLKLNLYSRKTENVQILFKNLCKIVQSASFRSRLSKTFQRDIHSRNPMTGSGFKYRFSQIKEKLGIQAVGWYKSPTSCLK